MTHGNAVFRGDRNRNARFLRLREFVSLTNAVVASDLANRKQMVVVCGHDSKVLARVTPRAGMSPTYPPDSSSLRHRRS